MIDDERCLALSSDLIDVAIVEIKTNHCTLNGPWTEPERQNVNRVLAAIECIPAMLSMRLRQRYISTASSSWLAAHSVDYRGSRGKPFLQSASLKWCK